MVATLLSPAADPAALVRYLLTEQAHDADSEHGFGARADFVSTTGGWSPENFVDQLRETRRRFNKTHLPIEAYHLIYSHSHEELDPYDPDCGRRAHNFALRAAKAAFPGRPLLAVTQRDNGRWETASSGERVWMPGRWHTHVVIPNVAAEAATIKIRRRDGSMKTVEYAPGRAINGDMKDIARLRRITDRAVRKIFSYDNEAYMQACREHAAGATVTKRDLALRAEREAAGAEPLSNHDHVRARLRRAMSTATSWDAYVARAAEAGISVRARGSGVSYSWEADPAVGLAAGKARARNLGDAFTVAEVTAVCEHNAALVAQGEVLRETEEEVAAVPVHERPRPVFLDDNDQPIPGNVAPWAPKPPREWTTCEDRLREAIDAALADKQVSSLSELARTAAAGGAEMVDDGEATAWRLTTGPSAGFACVDTELGEEYTRQRLEQRLTELVAQRQTAAREAERAAKAAQAAAQPSIDDLIAQLADEPAPDFDLEDEPEPEPEPEKFTAVVVSEPEPEPEPEPVKAAQAPAVAAAVGHDEVEDEDVSSRRRRRAVEQQKSAEAPQPSAVERLREADRVPVPPWHALSARFVGWTQYGKAIAPEQFKKWFDRLGATVPRWDDRPAADDPELAPLHYLTDAEGRYLQGLDKQAGDKAVSRHYAAYARQAYAAHVLRAADGLETRRAEADFWSERVGAAGGPVIPKGNAPKGQKNRQYGD